MTVLVVDDDPAYRAMAAAGLKRAGIPVVTAPDAAKALTAIRRRQPSIVVLAAGLAGGRGSELLRHVQGDLGIPVLLLIPAGGWRSPAGEPAPAAFLNKPFSDDALIARVTELLAEAQRHPSRALLSAGRLVLDRGRRLARTGDQALDLRTKEFDLLAALLEHAGTTLSRQEILAKVWGYDVPGKTRTVDVHVYLLRRRLQDAGIRIETERGVGYRLVSD